MQGRFNMGGTGVLPFCGDDRKMQLIVSRVPADVVNSPHEWGFTTSATSHHGRAHRGNTSSVPTATS